MSSTERTSKIGLNKWSSVDVPKMADFNSDNQIIDDVLGNHVNSIDMHLTNEERTAWNNPYGIEVYYGNGQVTQSINLNFSFEPTICVVFATNTLPGVVDIPNLVHYNYFGIATNRGSHSGLNLSGNVLTVTESATMIANYEKRSFNEIGKTYIVIAIR